MDPRGVGPRHTSWDMADRLHNAFTGAGLRHRRRPCGPSSGRACGAVWLQALADLVETLLPTIQAQGVATATEVGIETLTQRLLEEVSDLGATVIGRSEVGAWTRTPHSG
ncbi:hypothetical protein I551_8967 [Mycobacterium ulcerans str. Harvey]|uniref:Uncharacterized protein n=1 Tax=Mycobacterium ulcerans str. Harvey TaxID=1299332 RepID=A0ABN0R9B8_MYCUL|nr:hypothetical protein I551_8967 [Mycobacterium ulcerans str. Harvey]